MVLVLFEFWASMEQMLHTDAGATSRARPTQGSALCDFASLGSYSGGQHRGGEVTTRSRGSYRPYVGLEV